jgi:hypothetical protein
MFNKFFFRKSYRLWDNVEKYDATRQTRNDSIIWRNYFAYWLTQVIETHSECVLLLLFHNKNVKAIATVFNVYACVAYLVCSLYNTFTNLLERHGQTDTRYSCFSAASA